MASRAQDMRRRENTGPLPLEESAGMRGPVPEIPQPKMDQTNSPLDRPELAMLPAKMLKVRRNLVLKELARRNSVLAPFRSWERNWNKAGSPESSPPPPAPNKDTTKASSRALRRDNRLLRQRGLCRMLAASRSCLEFRKPDAGQLRETS